VNAGEPVHEMWLRLSIDDDMEIHEAEAVTDHAPYAMCPNITSRFALLKGCASAPDFTGKSTGWWAGPRGVPTW